MSTRNKLSHDSKLDADHSVSFLVARVKGEQRLQGIMIAGYDEAVCLAPTAALSLLSWLRQEESTLAALVLTERPENAQKHGIIPAEDGE